MAFLVIFAVIIASIILYQWLTERKFVREQWEDYNKCIDILQKIDFTAANSRLLALHVRRNETEKQLKECCDQLESAQQKYLVRITDRELLQALPDIDKSIIRQKARELSNVSGR